MLPAKPKLMKSLITPSLLMMTVTAVAQAPEKKQLVDPSTLHQPSAFYFWVVGVWLAVVVLFLTVMIFRFTCHNWSPDCPNPYQEETLGMPPGVLRSLLTLSLVVFIFLIELYRFQYPFALERFSELLIQGFEIMLGFYFGTKALQTLSNNETKSKKEAVKAAAGLSPKAAAKPFDNTAANG